MEPLIRITSGRNVRADFAELWQHRELVYFLAWRDVRVKYNNTVPGILWAVLQPLLLMIIFYFVFFRSLGMQTGIQYPVFAFGGLTLWGLFSGAITQSAESMISGSQMIRKIYFPRLVIPLASFATALLDFFIAFVIFMLLLVIFRQPVSPNAFLCFPAALLLVLFSSLGIAALVSALTVKYRDFRYVIPFGMQLLFFGSQIIYSIDNLQWEWLRPLLFLNPLNGALELFYFPMEQDPLNGQGIIVSLISSTCLFLFGMFYFRRTEKYFADII